MAGGVGILWMKACLMSSMYTWQPVYAAAIEPDDGCETVAVRRYEDELRCIVESVYLSADEKRIRSRVESLLKQKFWGRRISFAYRCGSG